VTDGVAIHLLHGPLHYGATNAKPRWFLCGRQWRYFSSDSRSHYVLLCGHLSLGVNVAWAPHLYRHGQQNESWRIVAFTDGKYRYDYDLVVLVWQTVTQIRKNSSLKWLIPEYIGQACGGDYPRYRWDQFGAWPCVWAHLKLGAKPYLILIVYVYYRRPSNERTHDKETCRKFSQIMDISPIQTIKALNSACIKRRGNIWLPSTWLICWGKTPWNKRSA